MMTHHTSRLARIEAILAADDFDARARGLRDEAAAIGDTKLLEVIDSALAGDRFAPRLVAKVLAEAEGATSPPRTSYRAIDVGFELRLHPEMGIALAGLTWPQLVEVDHAGGPRSRLCRDEAEAAAWLRLNGYGA